MSLFHSLLGAGRPANMFLISGSTLDVLNRYVDVNFDPNVYSSDGTALKASNLQLVFTQNGGTATGLSISSLTTTSGGALEGGENTVRVNLTLTGSASGTEYFVIKASGPGVYKDSLNRLCSPNDSTQNITLNVSYDAAYVSVLQYAIDNSIGIPTFAQRAIDNTLVVALKNAGAWDEFDALFFVANNVDRNFALIDWKNPSTRQATVSGTLSWTNYIGAKSDGTSYINTNYAPSTNGVKYLQDDCSVWAYIYDNVGGSSVSFGARGAPTGNTGNTTLNPRNGSNNATYLVNVNSTTTTNTANSNSQGLFTISRESSSSQKLYKNGSLLLDNNTASSARSSQKVYVCGSNNAGTAANRDSIRRISLVGFGSGMQDIISATNTAFQNWVTSTQTPSSLSGRVYLLSGQSNMDGRGIVSDLPSYLKGKYSIINGFPANCYVWWGGVWQILEPGVNASIENKVGPIFSFAYAEATKHAGESLFFIIKAVGGTNMAVDWAPTGSMFTGMISDYNAAIAGLLSVTSYEAYATFQGESDTRTLSYANNYETNEQAHMTAVFAQTSFTKAIVCNINSGLPLSGGYQYVTTVRTAKSNNDTNGKYGTGGDLIETSDLTYESGNVHLTTAGYVPCGERISAAF